MYLYRYMDNLSDYVVYVLECILTGAVYVGAGKPNRPKDSFREKRKQYPEYNFHIRLLETGLSKSQAGLKEEYYRQHFITEGHSMLNKREGGTGLNQMPTHVKDQVKQRMAASNPAKRPEVRKQLSERKKGASSPKHIDYIIIQFENGLTQEWASSYQAAAGLRKVGYPIRPGSILRYCHLNSTLNIPKLYDGSSDRYKPRFSPILIMWREDYHSKHP